MTLKREGCRDRLRAPAPWEDSVDVPEDVVFAYRGKGAFPLLPRRHLTAEDVARLEGHPEFIKAKEAIEAVETVEDFIKALRCPNTGKQMYQEIKKKAPKAKKVKKSEPEPEVEIDEVQEVTNG